VALICDTGPLYAAMDRADRDHQSCATLLSGSSEELLVPAPVLVELDWLSSARLGSEPFAEFLSDVEAGSIVVIDLMPPDYLRVRDLIGRYRDLGLGFVDAAVLAVVERLGERKLATLDHRHFGTIRPRHVEALELLPALT
jgi:predicted nucleic acid-binding protein